MKAISIRQPWAEMIARGKKKREYRSWATRHRGPLLICSGLRAANEDGKAFPLGAAICIVDVVNCEWDKDCYAWELKNPQRVKPVPVKGRLGIFSVDDKLVRPERRTKKKG